MTILPKSQPSGHPRGEASGATNSRENPPNNSNFDQSVVGGGNNPTNWAQGVVSSPSGSGWSPGGPGSGPGPGSAHSQVVGAPSSSPRWNSSAVAGPSGQVDVAGSGSGSVVAVGPGSGPNANKNSKKRPAPAAPGTRTTASASGREPPPSSAPPSAAAFYGLSCDAYDDYDYDEDDNGCCGVDDVVDRHDDIDDEDDDDDYDGGAPPSNKRGRHCHSGRHCPTSPRNPLNPHSHSAEHPAAGPHGAAGAVVAAAAAAAAAVAQQRNSPEPGTSRGGPLGAGGSPLAGGGSGGPGPGGQQDGYNSEDEYSHYGVKLTEEEWLEKDRRFERLMKRKGYVIKKMKEDGSCLFRAVADQIYGDQEMHAVVRDHCMNYIEHNSDHYSQYMTETVADYVERKRFLGVHGNHLEIQALSEMYNRPIHIYCYSAEPINIFQGGNVKNDAINVPVRLCYHRAVHYNSIVDPLKPSIGVGLGLPNYSPTHPGHVGQAIKQSEKDAVEKAMLEDKIRATDWEATNEAIEEQVARESYLAWLRDNERRNGGGAAGTATAGGRGSAGGNRRLPASTVTSGELRQAGAVSPGVAATSDAKGSSPSEAAAAHLAAATAAASSPSRSPKPGCSFKTTNSPRAGCSSERDSPKPGGSTSPKNVSSSKGFQWSETASFLNGLPPGMFGLEGWNETDMLTKVLAASQQEYFDSLKKKQQQQETPGGQDKRDEEDSTKSDNKQKSKSSSPSKSNH